MPVKKSESIICPVCHGEKNDMSFVKNDYYHYKCSRCKALYIHPRPTKKELEDYYNSINDLPNSSIIWTEERQPALIYWKWALKTIEKKSGRGPLLDIGCGGGQFLRYAEENGWNDLYGTEISEEAAKSTRNNTKAKVLVTDIDGLDLPDNHFSGITMWDVLEHLIDPSGAVKKISRLLKPGGLLILTTVNRKGISLRILKERTIIVMPPEHLTYFTNKSMKKLFDRTGLRVKKIFNKDVYISDWINLFKKGNDKDTVERQKYREHTNSFNKIVGSSIFTALRKATNLFLNIMSLGDVMTAVAKKIPEEN